MFNLFVKLFVAIALAVTAYTSLFVLSITGELACDKGTYQHQIFAGEDAQFCYYQRENANGGWTMDAVDK